MFRSGPVMPIEHTRDIVIPSVPVHWWPIRTSFAFGKYLSSIERTNAYCDAGSEGRAVRLPK